MSVLRKQCQRGVFDCHRCMTRMKNSGVVWGVDTGGLVAPVFDGTGFIADWPDIVVPLFYDLNFLSTGSVEGSTCYSAVIALNNLSSDTYDGIPTYHPGFVSVVGDDQTLRITLYFDEVWKLQLIWSIYIGVITDPGDGFEGFTDLRAIGIATYESQQDGCGSLSGDSMDLVEATYQEARAGNTVETGSDPVEWTTVPGTIAFRLIPNPNL